MRPAARNIGQRLLGHPWPVVGLVGAAVFAFWALGTRTEPHHVRVAFPSALNVVTGLDVRVNGFDIGKVSSVSLHDGQAIVGLGIDSGRFWPLHQGTIATIRVATLAGAGNRYVQLTPGPASAPVIPEGGIISGPDAQSPVELDQILNILNAPARTALRELAADTASIGTQNQRQLTAALSQLPPALQAYYGVSRDLAQENSALGELVSSTARFSHTLALRAPQISDLVTVAAATFATFASHSVDVRDSIARLPAALADSQTTLARLDPSIGHVRALVDAIGPGASRLVALARAAQPAVRVLTPTAETGVNVLATLQRAAPAVTTFAQRAMPLLSNTTPVLSHAATIVNCVRPYSPEAGAFAVLWDSWVKDHEPRVIQPPGGPQVMAGYGNVLLGIGLGSLVNFWPHGTPDTVITAAGYKYAFPRPPGLNAGQPWFIPQCGITPNALNPNDDPEHRFLGTGANTQITASGVSR